MNRGLALGLAICGVALLWLWTPARGAIPLRVGLGGDDDGIRRTAAAAFRSRVERIAGGQIHVSVAGPALWGHGGASELELVRSVMTGDPPMALVSSAALANFAPALEVLDAPCLFENRAQVTRVLHGPSGRALLDSLRSRGLVGMAFVGTAFRVLASRAALPAGIPLGGQRMATVQSASAEVFVETLGGEAVPAPLGRLSAMARDGFIDGADLDPSSLEACGLIAVTPYVLDSRHAVSTSVLIANGRFFDDLTQTQRISLWDGALAATSAGMAELRVREDQLRDRLAARGQWTVLDPSQRTVLAARVAGARRAVTSRIDPVLLGEIEAAR